MSGIFVNYRSADERFGAAALYELLVALFGERHVFRDCVSMDPGTHYPSEISNALEQAHVLLAVVGPDWFIKDAAGNRLIDRPRDWVHTEIARAFARGIPVVPVIVGDAAVPTKEQLPPDIAQFAHQQAAFVEHRRLGADVRDLARRLVSTVAALRFAWFSTRDPEPGDDPAPSEFLRAEYEIVPFSGRDRELAELTSWCTAPSAAAACLVTGPGGAGKTRLIRRLAQEMRGQAWLTGNLGDIPADTTTAALGFGAPTLVVIDYAETRPTLVADIAAALTSPQPPDRGPRRLVLVARSAGEWWSELCEAADDRTAGLFGHALSIRLGPLVHDIGMYGAEYSRATTAFARHLGRDETTIVGGIRKPDLENAEISALDIHAAALADVLDALAADATGRPGPAGDAIRRVLHHERRYWARTAHALSLHEPHRDRLNAIAATATLFATGSETQADAVFGTLRTMQAQPPDVRDRYRRWWQESHPGELVLNPLAPDRLGEAQVAECAALALDAAHSADDAQLARALTIVARTAQRHPEAGSIAVRILAGQPERAIPLCIAIAVQSASPGPLVSAMETAVAGLGDPQALATVISALPVRTEVLKTFCVRALRRGLEVHRALPAADDSVTAYLHAQLSIRLGDVADYPAALQDAAEAERRYRRLAADRADPFAFHLAIVLANKSVLHRRLDEIDTAIEAVDEALQLFEEVSAENKSTRAYHAVALAMKATHLSAAGEADLAVVVGEQALELLADATATMSTAAVRANLAFLTHNQAVSLLRAGADDAAADAARDARSLVAQLAEDEVDAYIRPLVHMVGRIAGPADPLDHALASVGIQGGSATADDVAMLVASADQAIADQFIDAVIRVCTPVWKDSSSAPPDELALRTGDWKLDVTAADNRAALLICLASAALADRGTIYSDVPWIAAVLPHIAKVDETDVGPNGELSVRLRLKSATREADDAAQLHALLPANVARTIHPMDLQDLVAALSALADEQETITLHI